MKKLTKIILSICLLALFAFSATGCNDLPNFINPNYEGGVEGNKYVISVTSSGGLPLNGVRVTATKDGNPVKSGISKNGKIELSLPLDEYTLNFSDLPAGYYIEEGQSFVTSAESYDFSAVFNSRVISSSATTGTLYSVGDVIHDFTVTDCEGNRLVLSDLVANNKAVMLNFWYRSCGPCRSEFPAIEEAYQVYKNDLKILAISNQDTVNEIKDFKAEKGLSFNMCAGNQSSLFGVSAYPTTVIIDRYGVIAYLESGSDPSATFWKTLFDYYTDEDYVQTPTEDDDEQEDGDETLEPVKPTEAMPESYLLEQAASDSTFSEFNPQFRAEDNENDAPYSWPWKPGEDNEGNEYIYPANEGVDNSFAILYVDFTITYGYQISFEYDISTDDNIYVIMNNQVLWEFTGSSNGWQTCNLYVFNRNTNATIGITYLRDTVPSATNDFVKLRNFKATDALDLTSSIDIYRDCAEDQGTGESVGKYENYTETVLGEDGYYHKKNNDGSAGELILANIAYGDGYPYMTTAWTELRFGRDNIASITVQGQPVEFYRNLYYISYWQLSGGSSTSFVFNGNDYTDTLIDNYYMQMFSDNQLVPVYPELKNMIQDFAVEYANNYGGAVHDNLWLEFCGYFEHYGDAHDKCFTSIDPVKGMALHNAIKIDTLNESAISNGTVVSSAIAVVDRPLQVERGTRYKFTAPKAGVYAIRSTYTGAEHDPTLFIYNGEGEYIDHMSEALDYDRFSNDGTEKYGLNFNYYIYLDKDEVCYPTFALFPGSTGEYPFIVTYIGERAEILTHCTTGEGLFTYDEKTGEDIYIAVNVILNTRTGKYYHVKEDGTPGSVIYIDFDRGSFFTLLIGGNNVNLSVKQMSDRGYFNFSSSGGSNYTQKINQWYYQATSKSTTDPTYGMLEATKEMTNVLNALITGLQETQDRVMAWRQMAYYYASYGPSEN